MLPIIGITMSLEGDSKLFVKKEYSNAIIMAGGIPFLLPLTQKVHIINKMVQKLDGLLLTGGEDIDPTLFGEEPIDGLGEIIPERDQMEINLIHNVIEQKKPILGICRGCQILNVALGGDMYQDIKSQKKPVLQHFQRAPKSHASHSIHIHSSSLLFDIIQKMNIKVNSYHHQAIRNTASQLIPSAFSQDGIIEAVEGTAPNFILGVQWHPECMVKVSKEALNIFRYFINKCIDKAGK
jgi:putative glutamine amidotransferase